MNLCFDPADRSKFQEEIEKTGFVKDYELKFRRRDGTEVDCLLASYVYPGQMENYRVPRHLTGPDLTQRASETAPSGREDGSNRPFGRRYGLRFQQLAHGDGRVSPSMLKARFPQGSPELTNWPR